MGLVQRDDQSVDVVGGTQVARGDPLGQPVGDVACQHLGGGVGAGEGRLIVEVAVGQRPDDLGERGGRPADVDEDAVGVEALATEGRVHDERRSVQRLRGPEHLAAEAVRHHHVVADGHAEHGTSSAPAG